MNEEHARRVAEIEALAADYTEPPTLAPYGFSPAQASLDIRKAFDALADQLRAALTVPNTVVQSAAEDAHGDRSADADRRGNPEAGEPRDQSADGGHHGRRAIRRLECLTITPSALRK